MPANEFSHVALEDLQEPPDREYQLDAVGEIEIAPALRALVEEETEVGLRARWPEANPPEFDKAVSEVVQFRLHTLETGGLNYRSARDLGQHLVRLLGRPEH